MSKANIYQQINTSMNVETASPHQLTSMLFEHAIKNTSVAKSAISVENHELKSVSIDKAIAIVAELQNSLIDIETNEIAANLNGLYDFVIKELVVANLKSSEYTLDRIVSILLELKKGWEAIA